MSPVTKMKPKPSEALRLVNEYLDVRAQIKDLEDTLTVLKDALQTAAIRQGGAFETPTHKIHMVEQQRRSISKDLLVQNGVTPKVIEKSTVVTDVAFVRVDAKKVEG